MVEGVCPLIALIGRLGRRGIGLVGMLNEVPAAIEHEFGPLAVQCEPRASPGMLEEDGIALPVVDVGELDMPIGELRGDQVSDSAECPGQLRVRAGDEARIIPRVEGAGLGLHEHFSHGDHFSKFPLSLKAVFNTS